LIEDVLKISNSAILTELETVIKKSKVKNRKEFNIYDFVGVLSKKEGEEISKFIEETCETINSDDWK
jgi:hypothetical protein